MKTFMELVLESGGKKILGVNPLQLTQRGLRRLVNNYSSHVELEQSKTHNKIIDKTTGNTIHKFTVGKIGPKAAIDTVTALRNHLKTIGAYKLESGESKGTIQQRKNITTNSADSSSAIPERSPEQLQDRMNRLKEIVKEKLGKKKQQRINRAIERLEGRVNKPMLESWKKYRERSNNSDRFGNLRRFDLAAQKKKIMANLLTVASDPLDPNVNVNFQPKNSRRIVRLGQAIEKAKKEGKDTSNMKNALFNAYEKRERRIDRNPDIQYNKFKSFVRDNRKYSREQKNRRREQNMEGRGISAVKYLRKLKNSGSGLNSPEQLDFFSKTKDN